MPGSGSRTERNQRLVETVASFSERSAITISCKWFLAGGTMGAVLAYVAGQKLADSEIVANLRSYSAPSASVYDAAAARLMSWFYARVVGDLAEPRPRGLAVDVGTGPGYLAMRLAQAIPDLSVVGLDVSAEMLARATAHGSVLGEGGRPVFVVGDVGALPLVDASVDLMVSTFSLHHCPTQRAA